MIPKYNALPVSIIENRNTFASGSNLKKQPKKIGEFYLKSKQCNSKQEHVNLNGKIKDENGKFVTCSHITYQLCQAILYKKDTFHIVDLSTTSALKNLVLPDSGQTVNHIHNDILHFNKTSPECHIFMGENALLFMESVVKKLASVNTSSPSAITAPIRQVFFLTSERHVMCLVASCKIDENDNFLYSLEFFDPNRTNDMAVIRFLVPFAKMLLADPHHKLIERFSKVISHGQYADEAWTAYRFESPPLASDAQHKAIQKTIYHGDVPLEQKFYRCMDDDNATELCNVLDAIDEPEKKRSHPDTPLLFRIALWKSALHTTGIWQAMQKNRAEALEFFLKAEGFKKLTFNMQKKIVMATNQNGAPGLYVAMQNGHSTVLQTLLDSSFFKGLSIEQQMQIIGCQRSSDGLSGLASALLLGKMDIFEILFTHWPGFKQISLQQQKTFFFPLFKVINRERGVKNLYLIKLKDLLIKNEININIIIK